MGSISILVGTILTSIDRDGYESLTFNTDMAKSYRMDHRRDCCESVTIEDICGDLDDLIGSPILQAEEATSDTLLEGVPKPENPDAQTEWTFYKLATIKGSVTIRWFGTSSGGYSTSVDFYEVPRVGLRYRVVEDIFACGGERTIPVGSVVEVTEAGGGRYPRVRDGNLYYDRWQSLGAVELIGVKSMSPVPPAELYEEVPPSRDWFAGQALAGVASKRWQR